MEPHRAREAFLAVRGVTRETKWPVLRKPQLHSDSLEKESIKRPDGNGENETYFF